jgi:hypothetical protein
VIASGEYNVVFDVVEQGYHAWRDALLPVLAVAAMALLWERAARRYGVTDAERRNARVIVGTGAVVFTLFSVYLLNETWSEYEEFVQRLRSGDYCTDGADHRLSTRRRPRSSVRACSREWRVL